jgi:hypothetical protein
LAAASSRSRAGSRSFVVVAITLDFTDRSVYIPVPLFRQTCLSTLEEPDDDDL